MAILCIAPNLSQGEKSMKIVVFGATGVIGQAVVKELSKRHEIICVGRTSGQYQVDFCDIEQVRAFFEKLGKFDAIVSAAGHTASGSLNEMTPEKYAVGLREKLMGQVNLVIAGQHHLNAGGSMTLTSGVLSHHPVIGTTNTAMVNGALEAFVRTASMELLPKGIRLNIVSPTITVESFPKSHKAFVGFEPVPAARVAVAYSRSVEGPETGKEYRVW